MAKLKEALTTQDGARNIPGNIECYAINVAELAGKIEDEVTDGGKYVKIDFKTGVRLIQIIWDQVKKASRECAGKELVVAPPQGVFGSLVSFVLSWLGLRL